MAPDTSKSGWDHSDWRNLQHEVRDTKLCEREDLNPPHLLAAAAHPELLELEGPHEVIIWGFVISFLRPFCFRLYYRHCFSSG